MQHDDYQLRERIEENRKWNNNNENNDDDNRNNNIKSNKNKFIVEKGELSLGYLFRLHIVGPVHRYVCTVHVKSLLSIQKRTTM